MVRFTISFKSLRIQLFSPTHSDVGSIDIVEDVHEPQNGEQSSIHLADQRSFLIGPGHIVDYIIVALLDVVDSELLVVMRVV